MGVPNLSAHVTVAESCVPSIVNENAPPSEELPPRAFQYRSATSRKRGSSPASECRVASMACFSEATRPIVTSPSCRAKTCGRSMAVSVIPRSMNLSFEGSLLAMMKNQGPSGEPCMCRAWMAL